MSWTRYVVPTLSMIIMMPAVYLFVAIQLISCITIFGFISGPSKNKFVCAVTAIAPDFLHRTAND